jgi:hypothetical protein
MGRPRIPHTPRRAVGAAPTADTARADGVTTEEVAR